ncbi:unnamed protein product, partial [Schistosoma bovis]
MTACFNEYSTQTPLIQLFNPLNSTLFNRRDPEKTRFELSMSIKFSLDSHINLHSYDILRLKRF